MLRLGLLDFLWVEQRSSAALRVRETPDLMRQAEQLGFHRYWVGEHHLPGYASASPEALIAAGLQVTNRIRLGTGALLLGYRNMMRLALDFRTLAAFGDRVDLGVARGRADRQASHELLSAQQPWSGEGLLDAGQYRSQLEQLQGLLCGGPAAAALVPDDAGCPELWICGADGAASLAAGLGASFCYTLFHPGRKSVDLLAKYRETLTRNFPASKALAAIAIAGSVTVDDAHAKSLRAAHRYLVYWPDVVAPAAAAADQLHQLQATYRPDDILWLDIAPGTAARVEAMKRLAQIAH